MPNVNKLPAAVLILVFFSGLFFSHKYRAPKRNYADFSCFYTAGKRILAKEFIYRVQDKETAEFRYAPIVAVLMSGLAMLDIDTADTIWFTLNFCLLIISLRLMKRIISPGHLDFKTGLFFYALAILGVFRFILQNFDTGQTNILMLSSIIIGLYLILKARVGAGGGVLAFSVMIKYTPLLFVPYFIIRKKFKLALIIIASVAAFFLLPALVIGFKSNAAHVRGLLPFLTQSSILDKITILDPENQSLLSFFTRMFTYCIAYFHAPPMPFSFLHLNDMHINLIFMSSAAILYFMVLYKAKHMETIDYALLLILIAVFNLNAWMHNFIFLIFAYFILVDYLIKNNFKDKLVCVLLGLSYILNILPAKAVLGKTIAYKLQFYSPYTISALITFLLLVKIKFSRKPAHHETARL